MSSCRMRPTGSRAGESCPRVLRGIARLHAMLGEHVGEDEPPEVVLGIETDRGPWVHALTAGACRDFCVTSYVD